MSYTTLLELRFPSEFRATSLLLLFTSASLSCQSLPFVSLCLAMWSERQIHFTTRDTFASRCPQPRCVRTS